MLGCHLVKHWGTTQKVVTLSSGRAELAGIVKGSAEALGLRASPRIWALRSRCEFMLIRPLPSASASAAASDALGSWPCPYTHPNPPTT